MSPDYNERGLLIELEPEAGRLYDRHVKVAQEWFPHDYIPYRLGRDFDKEPWTPEQPRLTGVAQTAFEINLLTEDNLPSYHRLIHGMFGNGDGAWINWVGRWTAEEGRHAIVIRDYLLVTRSVDPVSLERERMSQVSTGAAPQFASMAHALVYTTLQELATRISHRNTGLLLDDPAGRAVMARVAADENLHHLFYRDLATAAIEHSPSEMVIAMDCVVRAFAMPGIGIPDFASRARIMAKAGVYDFAIHHDQILVPIVMQRWALAGITGLSAEAEQARDRLVAYIERLDRVARRAQARKPVLVAGGSD